MEDLIVDQSDASPAITCDAPGYIVAGLLRRIGMLIVPSDMELPEELEEEGES